MKTGGIKSGVATKSTAEDGSAQKIPAEQKNCRKPEEADRSVQTETLPRLQDVSGVQDTISIPPAVSNLSVFKKRWSGFI